MFNRFKFLLDYYFIKYYQVIFIWENDKVYTVLTIDDCFLSESKMCG